jgi:hypothetical protein
LYVELSNTNPFHPLRIFTQDRCRNLMEKLPPATPAPTRDTRADLEKSGSQLVMVKSRGTVREADGNLRQVEREVPTPFFKTAGFETLAEFCTENSEKQLRASQAAAAVAPRSQRVVDSWNDPVPFASLAPHANVNLPLAEEKRYLIEAVEETALQISNVSTVRTIRLRNRDTKTGDVSHVSFLAPARDWPSSSLVIADARKGAIVELMST